MTDRCTCGHGRDEHKKLAVRRQSQGFAVGEEYAECLLCLDCARYERSLEMVVTWQACGSCGKVLDHCRCLPESP